MKYLMIVLAIASLAFAAGGKEETKPLGNVLDSYVSEIPQDVQDALAEIKADLESIHKEIAILKAEYEHMLTTRPTEEMKKAKLAEIEKKIAALQEKAQAYQNEIIGALPSDVKVKIQAMLGEIKSEREERQTKMQERLGGK